MNYQAQPATRSEEPLLLGMIGPPGGGKTLSSLKLAKGIQSVRGGDIIVLDTEGGRARKYNDQIPFKIVEMPPNARSNAFLDAINAQVAVRPAAIIVDSMSDEHDAYLAWHDEQVPNMGGNEWAAWAKPAAARKKLITGILKIKVPLIFTFRAKEKTKQEGRKVINIGWQPVAPLEIVHTLDLACLLPPRADGVPIWKSEKIGEDFVLKLPNYLAPHIQQGKPLDEQMGAAFARWAKGDSPDNPASATSTVSRGPSGGTVDDPVTDVVPSAAEYCEQWRRHVMSATNAKSLGERWQNEKDLRQQIEWTDEHPLKPLVNKVAAAIESLKAPA